MTDIDHDALARRIAERLSTANYIVIRDTIDAASFIAVCLREALPTIEVKTLTPEQAGRARWLLDNVDVDMVEDEAVRIAWKLLREVVGDE